MFVKMFLHVLYVYRNRVAILEQGSEYLYEDIYMRSWDLAKGLLGTWGDSVHNSCDWCWLFLAEKFARPSFPFRR